MIGGDAEASVRVASALGAVPVEIPLRIAMHCPAAAAEAPEIVRAHVLPVMYLAQGVTGLAAMLVLTGALVRADRRRAYVVMPLLLAFLVIIERVILAAHPGWVFPVLWLTVTLDWLWAISRVIASSERKPA